MLRQSVYILYYTYIYDMSFEIYECEGYIHQKWNLGRLSGFFLMGKMSVTFILENINQKFYL